MTIWVSSDLHLMHENIIKHCNRPFANAKEMSEAIITYHNALVKPEDHWYNLGDVTMWRGNHMVHAFIGMIKAMNGHKRLILGNHDHYPIKTYLEAGFEKVRGTGRWMDNMLFSHYPVHPISMGNAKACIHGHTHNAPDYPSVRVTDGNGVMHIKPYVNVCVERTQYKPVSLEDLSARVNQIRLQL